MTAFQQGATGLDELCVCQGDSAETDHRAHYWSGRSSYAMESSHAAQVHFYTAKFFHICVISQILVGLCHKGVAMLRQVLPGTKNFLMYGLTEAFRSTYLPPEELDIRPTSMGKAIPNTEILVLNEQGALSG